MTIEVTEEDILQGKRNSPSFCMVALAVKREVRENYSVAFDGINIVLYISEKPHIQKRIQAPDFVARQALNFDNGLSVQPFKFDAMICKGFLKK